MVEPRLNAALERIEAALARMESRPVVDAARHDRLRAAIAEAAAGLDRMIDGAAH